MKLQKIDTIRPSTYNPRKADPRRLKVIELSLRKLGWLLPVYADATGEILSGHQRHLVAERIGCKEIPVESLPPMDLERRRAVNVLFNRATNDMNPWDTPEGLTEALARAQVDEAAAGLPDLEIDSRAFYPCLAARPVETKKLVAANTGRWIEYAAGVSNALAVAGVAMPVVCTEDLRIVNGIGRLQIAAESKAATVPVVFVSDAQARLADAMLNLLSMDFDIHTRYADVLRWNSTGTKPMGRTYLGRCFTFALLRSTTSVNFDVKIPANKAAWLERFGQPVLDFGAGLFRETEILRAVGIDVTAFEPYCTGTNRRDLDLAASRVCGREFLAQVASKKKWKSIFMSAVLNSVPFLEDRRQIVTLLAALAYPSATVYACSSSRKQAGYQICNGKAFVNKSDARRLQFKLDYEPGITLGNIGKHPTMQKYHTKDEFGSLFGERFAEVTASESSNNVEVICRKPRPISPADLRAACEYEFDLPFPDDQRAGLATEAVAAFAARFGQPL